VRAAALLLLACLPLAPAAVAREQAPGQSARAPVQERSLALPDSIDLAALREQLRLGYAADVDDDGRVVIVTRKRDVVDRIVVELAERQLVARFYRSGASVNPKYAANELDGVLEAVEAYARRIGATSQGSARKRARGEPMSPVPGSPRANPPRPSPVVPPAAEGERLRI
jgi:hypothetical protein